jgi:outer membrane immunogenic protein
MRRSKRLLLVLTAIAAGHTAASAADRPIVLKAPPVPPAPAYVDLWTGFYGGPHFGFGWGNKKFFDNFPTPDGELDGDTTVKGFIGGLQGGYNRRFDWLLAGVEGDFTWSGVKSDFSCFPFGDQTCLAKPEWFGSLSGRLGVIHGPALFYVKGGAAWAQDHFEDRATCAGSQPRSRAGITAACGDTFFGNQLRPGWLVGVGIEYFFASQWSAKVEYNYMDFGSKSVPLSDGANGFFTEEIHQTMNLVKVGLNYHFDTAMAAAVPVRTLGYAASPTTASDENQNRVTVFSAIDISKYSFSGLAGALIAPYKDLDTSGLRFWMVGDAGFYKYPAEGSFIKGHYEAADVLAGYSWEGDNYSIGLLGGFNAVNHTLSEIDTTNKVQGTRFGAKVRGDATINPTPRILTAGEAEYSTAFKTYSSKAKFGYDFTDNKQIFVGPEVGALGDERYNQWRAGAHISRLKLSWLQIDISAGYAHDSVVGNGAYTTLELSMGF